MRTGARVLTTIIVCLVASVPFSASIAKDKPEVFGNRFDVRLGAYRATVDTEIRVDDNVLGNIGTEISFESVLGLEDSTTTPLLFGRYQFGRRSSIVFTAFELDRTANNVPSTIEIMFGPITIPINATTSSKFNTKVYAIGYGFSILNDDKKQFGLDFGLNIQDISMSINNEDNPLEPPEFAEVTAPLPTFGLFGGYRFAKKWYVRARAGVFALKVDDFEGTLTNLTGEVTHQTFEHVGFGFGYYAFGIDIDSEDQGLSGKVKFDYRGPMIFVSANF